MNKEEIKDWLSQYGISNYTIHDNLVVDVHESVWLSNNNLTSLPFQFGVIKGYFYCDYNQLTSLKHCPKEVHRNFSCSGNNLTSLEYCPKIIKDRFWCDDYLKKDIRYLRYHLAKLLQAL
jgi:Leucine-rich repeat (LRR) protein